MDRIALLQSFVEKAPNDPFPRYGLAMELSGQGRRDEALAVFASLVEQCPDYLPTFLMYGTTLAAAGQRAAAAEVLRRGIALAETRGDGKTRGELESALAGLAPA